FFIYIFLFIDKTNVESIFFCL
ncbi:DUF2649 family protein, partial [Spiroplasma sp. ChiS]